jgi:hypothetical protein
MSLEGFDAAMACAGLADHPENDRAAHDPHDRERMRIAVRIDTDHVVQLICKHHFHPQPTLQDTLRCRSGG